MGTRGERAAYKAAVWRYLETELGRATPRAITARLMGLPADVTGPGVPTGPRLHELRISLEHFARTYPVSSRVFVAYTKS